MRLVTFLLRGEPRLGAEAVISGEPRVVDLRRVCPDLPATMMEFLATGEEAWRRASDAIAGADRSVSLLAQDAPLRAPVPRPGKIICLGHNYQGHIGQGRTEPPEFPTYFCKTANTVIGPGEAVVIPPETQQADFEGELAVVIGRRARRVAESAALDVVAGYTAFNDISARDLQKRTSQWMLGKSVDTFGPMGPVLVTRDEIPDPHGLEISLSVNGVVRQHANTREMVFRISFLIAQLSAVMTLDPGDVIATGTPARTPAEKGADPFLHPGDVVSLSIEKIGVLANPVTAEPTG